MAEIYRPQQKGEETNPILTGVGVAYHVIDGAMKLAEITIDEFGGNDEEHKDSSHPVYVPHEQEKETQQLVAVRSELANFIPSQPESAISTQSENIPVSAPLTPANST